MAQLVAAGHEMILTHGNGPQVGNLLIQNAMVDAGVVVVAGRGGGVSVLRRPDGPSKASRSSSTRTSPAYRLALEVCAEALLVLTDVPGVATDFGKPTQRFLRRVTLSELEDHLVREPFSAGSMGPRVRAAYRFVRDGGRQSTICALEDGPGGSSGRRRHRRSR